MNLHVFKNTELASRWVALYVQKAIQDHQAKDPHKPFVLGLPTGSSIEAVYKELVRMVEEKTLSFKNVITFNMDEYSGLSPEDPQSYAYFMYEKLFDHIDIEKENIHLLDGLDADPEGCARKYEESIRNAGGIQLFLGGIGENAHIAFNEPYSSFDSLTHLQALTENTVIANSRFFADDMERVPKTALTVGLQTIMNSEEVLIMALGKKKSWAIQKSLEEPVHNKHPASVLQRHANARIVCDTDASSLLSDATIERHGSDA